MDIEVVIKKGVVYSATSVLLVAAYVSVITLAEQLFRHIAGYSTIWASVPTVFVLALLFNPLREKVQDLVDKLIFRERYEYQHILRTYANTLAEPLPLSKLGIRISYVVFDTMKLTKAFCAFLDRKTGGFKVEGAAGRLKERQKFLGRSFKKEDSPVFEELERLKKTVVFEEVSKESGAGPGKAAVKKWLEENGVALIIPAVSKGGKLIGILALGPKASGMPLSYEDIRFFEGLSPTVSAAVERTFLMIDMAEKMYGMEKMAAMGTITASVAHEIKNAFSFIYTLSQVMDQKWDDREFRKTAEKSFAVEAERMKMLLQNMADFGRTSAAEKEPVDIAKDVIKEIKPLLGDEMKKFNIALAEEYRKSPKALAVKDKLKQMLLNIMMNALHAMPKGGELKLSIRPEGGEVLVSVSDTGVGIPADKLHKIFDPFFTTKQAGTGLGLSITKKIVEEHGGRLDLKSEVGKGTTFTIALPAYDIMALKK